MENYRKFYEIARKLYKQILENEMGGTVDKLKLMFNDEKFTMNLVEEICKEQEEKYS